MHGLLRGSRGPRLDISSKMGEKNLGRSGYWTASRHTGGQNHGVSILGPERSRAACLAGPEARCPLTREGRRALHKTGDFSRLPGSNFALQMAFLGNRTRGVSILQGERRSLPNFLQPYCIVLGVVEGKRPTGKRKRPTTHNLSSVLKKWAPRSR